MYRAQSKLHDFTIDVLKSNASQGIYSPIFETVIPLTVRTAEAADFNTPADNLKKKYGSSRVYDNYASLTKEFLRYVLQPD